MNPHSAHLVVTLAGAYATDVHAGVRLSAKVLLGLEMLALRWPGSFTVALQSDPHTTEQNLRSHFVDPDSLPFRLVAAPHLLPLVTRIRPDIVLAAHKLEQQELLRLGVPIVWTSEHSLTTRRQLSLSSAHSLTARARISAGALRRERAFKMMAQRGAGLQANGFPAFRAYSRLSPSAMLFFNTQVRAKDAFAGTVSDNASPLRLVFSGRHSAEKGPNFALDVQQRLRDHLIDSTLTLFGDGPMRHELEGRKVPGVTFAGSVDYHSAWVPAVRGNYDLAILPHTQGDPAGTYLEFAALGIPIVGFKNESLSPLCQKIGIGWTAPRGDVTGLAQLVTELGSDPHRRKLAGTNGVQFMLNHNREEEYARRIGHLESVLTTRGSV